MFYTKFLIILFVLINSGTLNLYAQNRNIEKSPMETNAQFVNRLIPKGSKLVHRILEMDLTKTKGGKSIFYFFMDTLQSDRNDVIGQVLYPYVLEKNHVIYDTNYLCTLEPGAQLPAQIISVFQANADNDSNRELFVIYSTDQRKYDTENQVWYSEMAYDVLIFDDVVDPCNEGTCQDRMELLEKKFPTSTSGYTAKGIRSKLKNLGFKDKVVQ